MRIRTVKFPAVIEVDLSGIGTYCAVKVFEKAVKGSISAGLTVEDLDLIVAGLIVSYKGKVGSSGFSSIKNEVKVNINSLKGKRYIFIMDL